MMTELSKPMEAFRAYSQQMSGMARIAALGFLLLMWPGPATGQTDAEIEEVFWESVECESTGQVELYLEIYPTGRYMAEAHACLEGQLGLDRAAHILVQQGLAALDYEVGAADGLFGPATRRAIQVWQEAKGFVGTGYLTQEQAETLMARGREAVAEQRQREEARRQVEAGRTAQEADDTAYAEARRVNTAAAYEAYLAAYPQGRHVDEALTRQRAEAERRTREMEEQRARLVAHRAECEADVSNWPELNLSQQNALQQSGKQHSACLAACARATAPDQVCEAELMAYRKAKEVTDRAANDPLTLGAIVLTLGWSAILDPRIREREAREEAYNKCLSTARQDQGNTILCMTRCCAEM